MERVPRVGGGGIQGSAALKSAQCRKLYFGICCSAQMETLEFVFWSRNKAICPHLLPSCLYDFCLFPAGFHCNQVSMFTSRFNFHFSGWWFCTSWTASGWLHSGWGRERTPRGSTATTLRTSGEPPSLEPIQNLVRAILNSIPILALIGFRLPNKKGICKKLAQEYGLTKQTNDTGDSQKVNMLVKVAVASFWW